MAILGRYFLSQRLQQGNSPVPSMSFGLPLLREFAFSARQLCMRFVVNSVTYKVVISTGKHMKAVGYRQSHPIDHPDALLDVELPEPSPTGHDILVEVRAISVNPVDTKIRRGVAPPDGEIKVLGWDAAGVVRAVGDQVTLFKPGDRVMYAGSLLRPGTNSELHLVDERIVGRAPNSAGFEEAAALPLTSITAWEMLFDRLEIHPAKTFTRTLMVVGAAGGVGSIMVQLARQLTGLTVVATASRPESQDWIRKLGAHHVIDHGKPLSQELKTTGITQVDYVASLTHSDLHLPEIVESLAPQGKFGLIDDPESLNVLLLKRKSISLHWEFMYTRSMFETADMIEQHHLLNKVADLIDSDVLKTTLAERFGTINAANIRRAHQVLESGKSRGKIVLSGF
jgi:zinc-binding alcohol dehydrogenase family protein